MLKKLTYIFSVFLSKEFDIHCRKYMLYVFWQAEKLRSPVYVLRFFGVSTWWRHQNGRLLLLNSCFGSSSQLRLDFSSARMPWATLVTLATARWLCALIILISPNKIEFLLKIDWHFHGYCMVKTIYIWVYIEPMFSKLIP